MKLRFSSKDSIFKILQTLKKSPNYKHIVVSIDEDHTIFQHSRRGEYIKTTIDSHNLKVLFVAKSKKIYDYYIASSIPSVHRPVESTLFTRQRWERIWKSILGFHQDTLVKKNYMSLLLLIWEFLLLSSFVYVFWTLVSPNTTIIVRPALEVEHVAYNFRYYPLDESQNHDMQSYLSVPYRWGYLPYKYELSTHVQNVTYSQVSAKWTVSFFNTLPFSYSLLPDTKLITDDGIVYTMDTRLNVPAWSEGRPGTASVRVTAVERFENGELVWELWNIKRWSKLYVQNLSDSMEEKKIRAEASDWFTNWETIENGTVIEEDIKEIEENILKKMNADKSEYLKTNLKKEENQIVLPFPDMYTFDINGFVTTSELWEVTSFVDAKVETDLRYPYILRSDLTSWVKEYLLQRSEWETYHIFFDRTGTVFYDPIDVKETDQIPAHKIIPTIVPVVKKYNISRDALGLVNEIKDKIVNMEKGKALEEILLYDEIEQAEIRISPRRYTHIPDVKARISFEFADE